MEGFFSTTELASAAPAGCHDCGLYQTCQHPKMEPTGEGQKSILVIAEAPGEEEDIRGVQLIGKAGQKLREVLKKLDVDLDRDCRKLNSVNCRPPKNRTPTPQEITACRSMVMREANELRPHLVLLFGQSAVSSWLGHRYQDEKGHPALSRIRGKVFPDREFNCWVLPTFHPSYILRCSYDPVVELTWRKDISKGISFLGEPAPQLPDPARYIRTTTDIARIRTFLSHILERKSPIAVDYETSGLKPHAQGHFIRCIGIAVTPELSISFPWFPEIIKDEQVFGMMRAILTSPMIEKSVWGEFEWIWSRVMFDAEPQNMKDIRLHAHLDDCRRNFTHLKLQGMLHYGIIGYEESVGRFLKSKKSKENSVGENSFNRIMEAPLKELLFYNAMDSLITLWLRSHFHKLENQ